MDQSCELDGRASFELTSNRQLVGKKSRHSLTFRLSHTSIRLFQAQKIKTSVFVEKNALFVMLLSDRSVLRGPIANGAISNFFETSR